MDSYSIESKPLLARQPILDSQHQVFAYELLYRSSLGNHAQVTDSTMATAQVLVNSLNSLGVQSLVGSAKAFINFDRKMILDQVFSPLNPEVFVVELLEDIVCDQEILQALHNLKSQGFQIALDDVTMSREHLQRIAGAVPFASYIKMDLIENSPAALQDAVRYFRAYPHLRLLAEKVESYSAQQACKQWGYSLFQGYYFARPEIIEGKSIDARTSGILRLLQILQGNPEISTLEIEFRQNPEITLNLLRFLNSASVGVRTHIESIRAAILLLGHKKLQQWLTLMMFATPSEQGNRALFLFAAQRAKLLENLSTHHKGAYSFKELAFLVGMVSCMDALCHVRIESILAQIELSQLAQDALLHHKGLLGSLLELSIQLQSTRTQQAIELCLQIGIHPPAAQLALEESWAWANSLAVN